MAREVPAPVSLWYILLVLVASLHLLIILLHRRTRSQGLAHPLLFDSSVFVLVLLSGASLLSATEEHDKRYRLQPLFPDYPVRAHGWVNTPPQPTRNGFAFVLGVDSMRTPHWIELERRDVMVYVSARAKQKKPIAGQHIILQGTIEQFPRPRNPGENDYGATLGLMGVSGILRGTELQVETSTSGGTWRGYIGSVQQLLYNWIDQLHPGEHGSFVKGIILGYRADLPEDLKEAFMVTGTVHILAVSGSNVALIGLIVMVSSGFFRIRRWARGILTILGMVCYMFVTGGGPSITRATIMGVVVVLLLFVSRRGDVLQSLGVSACLLLLFDPRNLFDAGFLLSFASVAWIVTGSAVVEGWIRRMPEEVRGSYILRSALQLCGISLMAQLGTIPISAVTFGQISVVSILANLIVVPLSALVLLLGVAELAFYGLAPALAGVYASANALIIDVLLGFVRIVAKVPFAAVHVRMSGLSEAMCLYAVCAGLVWFSSPRIRKASLLIGLISLNVIIWGNLISSPGGSLDWITVDVGQGDAHLVRTPTGKVLLIDAAPSERIAQRVLLPFLERQKISEIDQLILTHPHRDHTGGIDVLLAHVPVRTLVVSDSSALPHGVLKAVTREGTAWKTIRAGETIDVDDAIRIYVMHPGSLQLWNGWNNNSIVLKIQFGADRLLLTGDLEERGEEELTARYGSMLQSDLLKIGHHGSKTSTNSVFLDAVRPHAAVIPVGWRNRFEHPSPGTMVALRERGIDVHATSVEGAAWWRSRGDGWVKVDWESTF